MPERPDSDREVLTSLPRSRPVRRSSKRGERPGADDAVRPSAKPVAPRKPRAAKAAKPAADRRATPAPAATPRAARPRAAATATPKAAPKVKPAAERPVPPRVTPPRKIPAAGYAAPDARGADPAASPATELITTAIQAAAELAQIGMTVGRQTLQSMLERLPKP